jgi:hypothetical protein
MLRRAPFTALLVATALVIAACSGSPTPSPSPASGTPAAATPTESATIEPTASSTAEQSALPTSLDPCQLVTASEASALAGASFTAGKEETTSGGAKTCVYGAQTLNVFQVLVVQAPDAATAQSQWTQLQAQAEDALKQGTPSGINVSLNVNDVTVAGADKAAVATASATISGTTISVSAIYVLKGATFFSISDLVLGNAAPSSSALEAQAQTTLGRVP